MKFAFVLSALAFCLVAPAACRVPPIRDHHPLIGATLWKQYEQLPGDRAIAIAGDPTGAWVGGAAGGYESVTEAKRGAIQECKKQRKLRRIFKPCLIYATGDEVVWIPHTRT